MCEVLGFLFGQKDRVPGGQPCIDGFKTAIKETFIVLNEARSDFLWVTGTGCKFERFKGIRVKEEKQYKRQADSEEPWGRTQRANGVFMNKMLHGMKCTPSYASMTKPLMKVPSILMHCEI